jgi:ketosteroid isomerase-like protein
VAANLRAIFWGAVLAGMMAAAAPRAAFCQLPEPGTQSAAPNPLTNTAVSPGEMLLFDLEARFAKDVAVRGGKGFAEWFAEDAVLLGNGVAPVRGREAIAKASAWSPQDYQLTWTPTEAVMGPSGDIGYTWSHYEGRSRDAAGNPVLTSGRFITIWRRQPDGSWKVVLDAGANEPVTGGDCCKVPSGH